jgi:hypothetical protein
MPPATSALADARKRSQRCLGEEDMGMQFDHLMHWVPDLDAAMQAYQGLGFTIQPGGEHPGVGTRNAA